MLLMAFSFVFIFVFMQARIDGKAAAGRNAISTMTSCGNLRLGMTRDEIHRLMGVASREYQTEGPSGGPALALKFELPIKEDRFPLVVLEEGRLVEAVCTEQHRLRATPEEIAALLARERAEDAGVGIGSDSRRR